MSVLQIRAIGETTWTPLPDPSSMTWGVQDIDSESSSRDQLGTLHRDRIATKRKLTCEWPPNSMANASTLLGAVDSMFFELEYPDVATNTRKVSVMYVGDRTASFYMYGSANSSALLENIVLNFIER